MYIASSYNLQQNTTCYENRKDSANLKQDKDKSDLKLKGIKSTNSSRPTCSSSYFPRAEPHSLFHTGNERQDAGIFQPIPRLQLLQNLYAIHPANMD